MRLFTHPNQSVAIEFLRGLEQTISESAKPHKKTKTVYYKPSSLNCLRMMYFYRTQTEVDDVEKPAAAIGVLESGQDRHLRIQKAITQMKSRGLDCEWVDVETYIQQKNLTNLEVVGKKEFETTVHHKELDLLFLCDGLVRIGNTFYLIEIKTENSTSFYNRTEVAQEHRHQAACYSLAFCISNVIFIYENRDVCTKKAFLYTVPQSVKNEVIGMIERCEEAVQKRELPLRIECKACNFCDYKKKCKALK